MAQMAQGHHFSYYNFMTKALTTFIAAVIGYAQVVVLENVDMYLAILGVVGLDFLFGTAKAIKFRKWKVARAMKVVYYLFSYWTILFVVLQIEKATPSAFWISEAIFLPIIIFQMVSALKNASLVGFIPQGLLLQLLQSIDKHKDAISDTVSKSFNSGPGKIDEEEDIPPYVPE